MIHAQGDATERDPERQEPDSSVDGSLQDRARVFRVRPVPIDQQIGE
jgi:hypothetical protein